MKTLKNFSKGDLVKIPNKSKKPCLVIRKEVVDKSFLSGGSERYFVFLFCKDKTWAMKPIPASYMEPWPLPTPHTPPSSQPTP